MVIAVRQQTDVLGISFHHLCHNDQYDQGNGTNDQVGITPTISRDQYGSDHWDHQLAGPGAHLDQTGYHAAAFDEPAGNRGEGNDVMRCKTHARQPAVKK